MDCVGYFYCNAGILPASSGFAGIRAEAWRDAQHKVSARPICQGRVGIYHAVG